MNGKRVHFSRSRRSYNSSQPRTFRRRPLPAHFLAPDESESANPKDSTIYDGLVDDYHDYDEELPEISYWWD
jgi:hypothetical protein